MLKMVVQTQVTKGILKVVFGPNLTKQELDAVQMTQDHARPQ